MKQRKMKQMRTRREVGMILHERQAGMSAGEIAEALTVRRRRSYIQATPITVAQLLRGAKGIEADKEMRESHSSVKRPVKIYSMSNFNDYTRWLEGGQKNG